MRVLCPLAPFRRLTPFDDLCVSLWVSRVLASTAPRRSRATGIVQPTTSRSQPKWKPRCSVKKKNHTRPRALSPHVKTHRTTLAIVPSPARSLGQSLDWCAVCTRFNHQHTMSYTKRPLRLMKGAAYTVLGAAGMPHRHVPLDRTRAMRDLVGDPPRKPIRTQSHVAWRQNDLCFEDTDDKVRTVLNSRWLNAINVHLIIQMLG